MIYFQIDETGLVVNVFEAGELPRDIDEPYWLSIPSFDGLPFDNGLDMTKHRFVNGSFIPE
ncbi:MAG: hypothetical protein VW683_04455 [Betaproteobacteria bacterium]